MVQSTGQNKIHSLHHYDHDVAIGNPKRHMHKASHCGSKQQ